MPGPLRGQIPRPSRKAGTQADRALRPGRGNDEEVGCGQRIETYCGGLKLWDGDKISGFSKMRDLSLFNVGVFLAGGK